MVPLPNADALAAESLEWRLRVSSALGLFPKRVAEAEWLPLP